jgi:hypothetical protein
MARIREVWAPNLEGEMRNIRDLIESYPYVTMVLVSPPSTSYCRLTTGPGHGIPWSCRSSHRNIQDVLRLSLSNDAM